MEKYKIVAKTNGWIASRDSMFNGKTEVTIDCDLTLQEAQKKLLDYFNNDYSTNYSNWGLARCNNSDNTSTYNDGTRSYEYDSRSYFIELDEEERWYCSSYDALDSDIDPDCDFFIADNDEEAVSHAKELASMGIDDMDEGHIEIELISVCRVDPSNEWEDIETIWC